MDASSVDDLAAGGNFRLETDLGPLDVMQWVAGIEVDNLYAVLAASAMAFTLDDLPLRYCGLGHLRAMKQAAGRPRDLDDLEHPPAADSCPMGERRPGRRAARLAVRLKFQR